MFRKDFISKEIDKLARVLARIIGYKNDNETDKAEELFFETLNEEFSIEPDSLNVTGAEQFLKKLTQLNYSADKLNILADLIYENAHPFNHDKQTLNQLNLLLALYTFIETQHHTQSFQNIARAGLIKTFLSQTDGTF